MCAKSDMYIYKRVCKMSGIVHLSDNATNNCSFANKQVCTQTKQLEKPEVKRLQLNLSARDRMLLG